MAPRLVDIEPEFHEVVRGVGGVVIEDLLGTSIGFQNADYVFHFEKVVAELKCISDDNVLSAANQFKADKLMNEWYESGRCPYRELDMQIWHEIPQRLQIELYRLFTKSIKRRIAKANRQIRETKEHLKLEDYKGLLIIANDGLISIPPAAFIHATQLTLQKDFREIRHFVFLTVNLFSSTREAPCPVLFWISFDMQDGPAIDQGFLDRLGTNWRRHCTQKMGVAAFEKEMQDVEGFWKAQHLGRI